MNVRPVRPEDADEWRRLRALLWPGEDHSADIAAFFAGDTIASCPGGVAQVLVVERGDGRLGGFVEVGLRPFADGCETRPVGYVEGWFVDADLRRRGAGARLVRAAEEWVREKGCVELASDCAIDNEVSLRAHRALGFGEVERVILLRKKIA
jgi:aminoglycoside 6'-N-acetyltransferase I